MKRKSFIIILLFVIGSMVFANDWDVQELPYEQYVCYKITDAPEQYKNLKGSYVCAMLSRGSYRSLYEISCKSGIIEFLKNEEFDIGTFNNMDTPFLHLSFLEKYFPEVFNVNIPVTKDDLDFIWEKLSTKYAGFSDMKKKGLTEKKFYKIKNTKDLKKLLDKCVEDCHFQLRIREFSYEQKTAYDEGTRKSKDSSDVYFEKETSNAYYVRFTNCTESNTAIFLNMPAVSFYAQDKDFIILDARSNSGGSQTPLFNLCKSLNNLMYKGTVIVLQDNWSYSSGEVWSIFGMKGLKFKTLLVGTHSGGMQKYGNCALYRKEELNISIYLATGDFSKLLPANYLGEGKGYEPDIWATTKTMASVLTGLGADVTGIEFK